MKVLVVREREDMEFITKMTTIRIVNNIWSKILIGCRPIVSLDHFLPEHLSRADLVEQVSMGTGKVVKVSVTSYGVVNCVGVVGSIGDRSAGCLRMFDDPGSERL